MHADVANCIQSCSVCQGDKLPMPPKEELCWMDKGGAPFIGWSIDVVGPFPWDGDGNCYLLVAVDPFSKWVETHAVPLLHSWRAAKFLYDDLVARWGKPHYVRIDNSAEFAGSFAWLCKGLGIIYHHITVSNSKANSQVEWMIRMLRGYIRLGLTKEPATFWMNHLASALLLLCITVSKMISVISFLLTIGRQPLLLSMAVPGLPCLPNQLALDKEEPYLAKVSYIIEQL